MNIDETFVPTMLDMNVASTYSRSEPGPSSTNFESNTASSADFNFELEPADIYFQTFDNSTTEEISDYFEMDKGLQQPPVYILDESTPQAGTCEEQENLVHPRFMKAVSLVY